MQVSEKPNTFCFNFIASVHEILNILKKNKTKKNEPHSFSALVFLKLLSPKDVVT